MRYPSQPTTDQGNVIGSRMANEIEHRFDGDMRILSKDDQRDSSMAELLAGTGDVINVKSFGATGDGTTDDTVAIQTAIDKAFTDFGSVFIPVGTYIVSATLTVPADVTIEGSLRSQFRGTLIKYTGAAGILFDISGAGVQGSTLRNLTIGGGVAGSTAIRVGRMETYLQNIIIKNFTGDNGILCEDVAGGGVCPCFLRITGLRILNDNGTLQRGVLFKDNTNAVTLERFQITQCAQVGIRIEFCNNLTIHDGDVENMLGAGVQAGIQVFGGNSITIRDIYMEAIRDLPIDVSSANIPQDVTAVKIEGIFINGLDSTGTGIRLEGGGGKTLRAVTISSCFITRVTTTDISIKDDPIEVLLLNNDYQTLANNTKAPFNEILGSDVHSRLTSIEYGLRTPGTLAAGDNNNVAVGTGTILRLTADAGGSTITGLSGASISPHMRRIMLVSIGAGALTIGHQDTASTAANRIISATAADVVLGQDDSAELVYDPITLRWRIVNVTQ